MYVLAVIFVIFLLSYTRESVQSEAKVTLEDAAGAVLLCFSGWSYLGQLCRGHFHHSLSDTMS